MKVNYHFYKIPLVCGQYLLTKVLQKINKWDTWVNRHRIFFEDRCKIAMNVYSNSHASSFLMSLYPLDRTTSKYVEHVVRSIFVDKQKDQPKKMLSLNRQSHIILPLH